MNDQIPPAKHGPALTGVKAKPSGLPAASLDPGSGRARQAVSGMGPDKIRSPRIEGIASRALGASLS